MAVFEGLKSKFNFYFTWLRSVGAKVFPNVTGGFELFYKYYL
jgi:hypothetical protein